MQPEIGGTAFSAGVGLGHPNPFLEVLIMAFSDNLQFLRAHRGLTQEQLAEALNVSRQSVSKWESGAAFPEMDTLLRLCELYGVSLDLLLRGDVRASLQADTAGYDAFFRGHGLRVSLAVGGILLGVALMLLTMAAGLAETLSVALLLTIIAICVVVLVASGLLEEDFRKKNPAVPDCYTQEEQDAAHRRFIWLMCGGIGGILAGVIFLLLFFTVFPEREPYELTAGGVFFILLALSVSALIYGGMDQEKYQVWKYNRDNNPTPQARERNKLIDTICSALMLTATAVYVGLGLALDLWRSAWWLFAVGGILCGLVHVLLDPYKDDG